MNKKSRSSKRLIISTVGVALAIPLVAVPASASLGNSSFFVHAQNIQSPEFKATAGQGGAVSNPGGGGSGEVPGDGSTPGTGSGDGTGGGSTPGTGGGSTPGTGGGDTGSGQNDSTVLASYKCGPLAVDVTKGMVNFSKTNEDLAAQGGTLKPNADGWSTLSTYDMDKGSMQLGFTKDGSQPLAMNFSSGSDLPNPGEVAANTKLMVLDVRPLGSDGCNIVDSRKAPRAGQIVGYTYSGSGTPGKDYYAETRYLQEDGGLRLVVSGKQADGALTVNRSNSLSDYLTPVQSDTEPFSIRLGTDGQITADQYLKTTVDGYDYKYFSKLPDGSGSVMYKTFDGIENGQQMTSLADRKHGPVQIYWDTDGNLTMARSSNGGVYSSVADYNAGTGQNWDGSYLKASDFDLSVPFAPTATP